MTYDIAVIIPFFNEKENIPTLISELNRYISQIDDIRVEVIFVDDGSTDNSSEILKTENNFNFAARIIKLSKNYGSHAALRAGIYHSQARYITFLFADLQDPVDLIFQLYSRCIKGYDIVWAERRTTEIGFIEKQFSRLYAQLMRKFAISDFPEKGFDIVMFSNRVREELNQNIEANSSLFLQILSLGFRQDKVNYDRKVRTLGKSKWTISKKIKLVIDSFVGFSYSPIRFVTIMGIMLSLAGFMWTLYIVLRAILVKDLEPGWPTMISILMIGFGITNISLGIIAEYLWRTLDAARCRKVFIVDEIYNQKIARALSWNSNRGVKKEHPLSVKTSKSDA